MSTLQVANVWFESTANNRIQYLGANNFAIVTAGSETISFQPTQTNSNKSIFMQVGAGGELQYGWNFNNPGGPGVYFYGRTSDKLVGLFDNTNNLNRWQCDTSGNFTAAGNVTAYSDLKLKTDIETIDNALDKVSKMRGVMYTRKDTGSRGTGVIAQEMQEVLPEVVLEGENLSVAYGNIVGVLIEAIKELEQRVADLEAK